MWKALQSTDLIVPDGIGVALALSARLGRWIPRAAGPDLFGSITSTLNRRGGAKYYLVASSEAVVSGLRAALRVHSNIEIAGWFVPSFAEEMPESEFQAIVEGVRRSDAGAVWIGIGAPKQEKFMRRWSRASAVPALAVGAALDFWSGTARRPAAIFRSAGLEWLARLWGQPGRLWKRTFVSAPLFVVHFVIDSFRPRAANRSNAAEAEPAADA